MDQVNDGDWSGEKNKQRNKQGFRAFQFVGGISFFFISGTNEIYEYLNQRKVKWGKEEVESNDNKKGDKIEEMAEWAFLIPFSLIPSFFTLKTDPSIPSLFLPFD